MTMSMRREFGRFSVKYYFKRPYLPEWRRIDARVRELVNDLAVAREV